MKDDRGRNDVESDGADDRNDDARQKIFLKVGADGEVVEEGGGRNDIQRGSIEIDANIIESVERG